MLSPVLKSCFEEEMRQQNACHIQGSQMMLADLILLSPLTFVILSARQVSRLSSRGHGSFKNFSFLGTSQHFISSLLPDFAYSFCPLMSVLPRPWLTALLEILSTLMVLMTIYVRDDSSTFPDQNCSEIHNCIQLLDIFTWISYSHQSLHVQDEYLSFPFMYKMNAYHFPVLPLLSSPLQ